MQSAYEASYGRHICIFDQLFQTLHTFLLLPNRAFTLNKEARLNLIPKKFIDCRLGIHRFLILQSQHKINQQMSARILLL